MWNVGPVKPEDVGHKEEAGLSKDIVHFEEGDEDQSDLMRRARSIGFNAIAQSKSDIRAFDACDLAAWKARVAVDDSFVRKEHMKGPSYGWRIMKSISEIGTVLQNNGLLDTASMVAACDALGVPKRAV